MKKTRVGVNGVGGQHEKKYKLEIYYTRAFPRVRRYLFLGKTV